MKLNFNAERDTLIAQYRFAVEQALAKANFLGDPDLTLCQAFLLFLVIVRRHDDTRFAWTLTGLIIRICQAIGLHRDGTNFPNISPFEVEMRRRLFWAVCILDLRSAEDQGTDLTIVDRTFDTQTPLNINDTDIDPSSKELPQPREGTTDMTFSLIRYEICALARRLHAATSAMPTVCPRDASQSVAEREALLREVHERIQDRYLKNGASEDSAKYWVAAHVARLIVAKMTLLIYQPVLFPGPGNETLSSDRRQRLLTAAIEVFEYNHLLNTDPRTKQWRWLFQTYTQWHAVAYVLLELTHTPWNSVMEQAWCALTNSIFTSPKQAELEKMADNAAVWLPLKKLYYKAKRHREAELARLRSDPEAARQLDLETRASAPPPPPFSPLPGSILGAGAHERWRKLVNAPPPQPLQGSATRSQQPAPRRSESQSTTMSGPSGPGGTRNTTSPSDDFMDQLMDTALRTPFEPSQFIPLAWSVGPPLDIARDAILGFSNGDVPRADDHGARTTSMGPLIDSGPGYASAAPAGGQQHPAAGVQLRDDNPPPWMWSPGPLPVANQLPGPPVDDMDVNMDEGFDWQNWQESIQLEMSGGGTGGVWGQGI